MVVKGVHMKERFEGVTLIDALKRQELVSGSDDLANSLANAGTLVELAQGDELITEGAEDNDIYFLLAGSVAVMVKGNNIATRRAGQHVGEMAALEPAQKRSATVIAHNTLVVLRLTSAAFMSIGRAFPQIWLPIAQELSRRLHQRNELIPPPNDYPKLFIVSSSEALEVAREIQSQLERDVFSTVWDQGVFFAGGYPLEALEKAVSEADFAIAVAEPDDIVEFRGNRLPTVRDNVLFELGLFMGKLTRHRAILVHPRTPELRLPSDLHGLTLVSYTPSSSGELSARLAPVCNHVRKIIKSLGVRTLTT
jgi:CRP/FNR family transcriptional regulator, cyclic AMP receptor protein